MVRMSDDLVRVQEYLDYWLEEGGNAQELEQRIQAEISSGILKLETLSDNPDRALRCLKRLELFFGALKHLQDWIDERDNIDPDDPVEDMASLMIQYATWAGTPEENSKVWALPKTPENFINHFYARYGRLPNREATEDFLSQFFPLFKVTEIMSRWIWEPKRNYASNYVRVEPKPVYVQFTDNQTITKEGIRDRLEVLGYNAAEFWARTLKEGNFRYKPVSQAEAIREGLEEPTERAE